MIALSWFLIGFLSAFTLCVAAAFSYYLRAKSRVRAIEDAIHRYKQADALVGEAVNQVYSDPN